MIERFNFFDVYAYLLPGMALLGSIWLPFGIVAAKWPASDFSSALLSLVAAYIVGHVLYHPAKEALPTEGKGWYGKNCTPAWRARPSHASDFLLDAEETTFPGKFKEGLGKLINDRFKDQVHVDVHFDWNAANETAKEAESKQRELAFLLCRSALVTGKVASYGEQFEGLYQLLRSLTVVFVLAWAYHVGWALAEGLYQLLRYLAEVMSFAWAYHVGWALAAWKTTVGQSTTPVAIVAALAIACAAILNNWGSKGLVKAVKILGRWQVKRVDRQPLMAQMSIGLIMFALLLCPFFLNCFVHSAKAPGSCNKALLLAGVALTDAIVALRCSSAYKPFAKEFAKAVYRDFYVYATSQTKVHEEAE